jgi:hypothetical protein
MEHFMPKTYLPAAETQRKMHLELVTLESIQQTIRAAREDVSMYELHCTISWNIRQFCKEELSDTTGSSYLRLAEPPGDQDASIKPTKPTSHHQQPLGVRKRAAP